MFPSFHIHKRVVKSKTSGGKEDKNEKNFTNPSKETFLQNPTKKRYKQSLKSNFKTPPPSVCNDDTKSGNRSS